MSSPLAALSPLDGRYAETAQPLRPYFSEQALIRYRVRIELEWLQALASEKGIRELKPFGKASIAELSRLLKSFSDRDAEHIKNIEAETNHDVKAIEYWLKSRLAKNAEAQRALEFIHFACTSEDINNLAYALMVAESPHRLDRARSRIAAVAVLGKINGAVGNYNAHVTAYPGFDWERFCRRFVERLGLEFNAYTTQIEPHDWLAELLDAYARANSVLLDLDHDLWGYISLGYFTQKVKAGEVGSSTMPHKVNPIDFENSEGNVGVANALLRHLSEKLPVSRWQRDLSDSTAQRNVGAALGYTLLAYAACLRGLGKLEADPARLAADLEANWEVLAEAVQQVMRRHGVADAYDKLKAMSRGKRLERSQLAEFVKGLPIPPEEKKRLLALTPAKYTGLAAELAKRV